MGRQKASGYDRRGWTWNSESKNQHERTRAFLGCDLSPTHKHRHRLEGVQLQPGEGAGHGRREHHGCFDQLLTDGGDTGLTNRGNRNHNPGDISNDDCWGKAARLLPLLWWLYLQCHTCLWSPRSKSAGLDLKQTWARAAKVTQGKESLSYKQRNRVWWVFLTEYNTGWGEACTKHFICISIRMYVMSMHSWTPRCTCQRCSFSQKF